ncbi:MAG TPA: STAS domain-containing protein [Chitinophagaceae bacterium]|nr:STAS domain-containing protein [Chitinophagaceae bacterium]
MKVKIDTKEKFHVITWLQPQLSATMTEEFSDRLLFFLQSDIKNIILNLKELQSIDNISAENLVKVQQKFYENNASFVICEIQTPIEEFLDKSQLLEMMNMTPTESEAWDVIQMEEIERELLDEESES